MNKSRDRESEAWVSPRTCTRALRLRATASAGLGAGTLLRVYRQWKRALSVEHPNGYGRQVLTNLHLDWRRRRPNVETRHRTGMTNALPSRHRCPSTVTSWRGPEEITPRQRTRAGASPRRGHGRRSDRDRPRTLRHDRSQLRRPKQSTVPTLTGHQRHRCPINYWKEAL